LDVENPTVAQGPSALVYTKTLLVQVGFPLLVPIWQQSHFNLSGLFLQEKLLKYEQIKSKIDTITV
jgi:hypothetical protein